MKYLIGVCLGALSLSATAQSMVIVDSTRDRSIPLEVVLPQDSDSCTTTEQCGVALLVPVIECHSPNIVLLEKC